MGYQWVALELDDYANAPRWGPFRHACHAEGLKAGPWFTDGGNIRNTPADADFAIAELEGPGDYDGIMRAIADGALPACPKAVGTNFNVPLIDATTLEYRPDKAKPLIDAGFHCLTECYLADTPTATPDRMHFTGTQKLGWSTTQPIFGVYGQATLDTYAQWHDWPGWSVYLAEYVL